LEPKTSLQVNLVIWAILVVGCAAVSLIAYYFEAYEYLIYVVLAVTIAAMFAANFFMTRKKKAT
jgi:hypothetical protein